MAQVGTAAEVEYVLQRFKNAVCAPRDRVLSAALKAAAGRRASVAGVDSTRMVAHLVAAGADLTERDSEGATALHVACAVANLEMVATMLHLRADVLAASRSAGSCLMSAVNSRNVACCVLLAEAMADPCASGRGGSAPLLVATERSVKDDRYEDIVQILQTHARAHYVELVHSFMDYLFSSECALGDAVVREELNKDIINYLHLADIPEAYMASLVNQWLRSPQGRCSGLPEARAEDIADWPPTLD